MEIKNPQHETFFKELISQKENTMELLSYSLPPKVEGYSYRIRACVQSRCGV